jgi:hypothetical protein
MSELKSYWAYEGKGSGQMHERGTPCADWPVCKEYVLKSEAIAYAEERVKEAMDDRFSGAEVLAEVEKAVSREQERIIKIVRWNEGSHVDKEALVAAIRSRGKPDPTTPRPFNMTCQCCCHWGAGTHKEPDCECHGKQEQKPEKPDCIWKMATSSDSVVNHIECCCPRCKARPPKIERLPDLTVMGALPRDMGRKINELTDVLNSIRRTQGLQRMDNLIVLPCGALR